MTKVVTHHMLLGLQVVLKVRQAHQKQVITLILSLLIKLVAILHTTICSRIWVAICGSVPPKASVGELPSHFHEIVSNTVNLTGSAGYFVGADSPSYSGILTVTKGSKGLTGGGGGHTQNYLNIHANITPSVNVSFAGNNQPHQNMPPFISIFCWKRIA